MKRNRYKRNTDGEASLFSFALCLLILAELWLFGAVVRGILNNLP